MPRLSLIVIVYQDREVDRGQDTAFRYNQMETGDNGDEGGTTQAGDRGQEAGKIVARSMLRRTQRVPQTRSHGRILRSRLLKRKLAKGFRKSHILKRVFEGWLQTALAEGMKRNRACYKACISRLKRWLFSMLYVNKCKSMIRKQAISLYAQTENKRVGYRRRRRSTTRTCCSCASRLGRTTCSR